MPRSMPRPPLAWMLLPRMASPVVALSVDALPTTTPMPVLPALSCSRTRLRRVPTHPRKRL